jgi:hypothetical protein
MDKIASELLVERLADWGVDTVFGLPGDGINGIMEGLRRHQDNRQLHLSGNLAIMACALPYAIAAQWAYPGRRHPALPPGGLRPEPKRPERSGSARRPRDRSRRVPYSGIVGLGQTGGGERGKLGPVGDPELGVDV